MSIQYTLLGFKPTTFSIESPPITRAPAPLVSYLIYYLKLEMNQFFLHSAQTIYATYKVGVSTVSNFIKLCASSSRPFWLKFSNLSDICRNLQSKFGHELLMRYSLCTTWPIVFLLRVFLLNFLFLIEPLPFSSKIFM